MDSDPPNASPCAPPSLGTFKIDCDAFVDKVRWVRVSVVWRDHCLA